MSIEIDDAGGDRPFSVVPRSKNRLCNASRNRFGSAGNAPEHTPNERPGKDYAGRAGIFRTLGLSIHRSRCDRRAHSFQTEISRNVEPSVIRIYDALMLTTSVSNSSNERGFFTFL